MHKKNLKIIHCLFILTLIPGFCLAQEAPSLEKRKLLRLLYNSVSRQFESLGKTAQAAQTAARAREYYADIAGLRAILEQTADILSTSPTALEISIILNEANYACTAGLSGKGTAVAALLNNNTGVSVSSADLSAKIKASPLKPQNVLSSQYADAGKTCRIKYQDKTEILYLVFVLNTEGWKLVGLGEKASAKDLDS